MFLVATSACGNTARGVKEDASQAGEKTAAATERVVEATSNTRAQAGEAMSGAIETVDVKSALLADTRVTARGINVGTNEERKTVTLRGTVPTKSQRTLAGEVARSKAPGYAIINKLTIRP